MNNDDLFFIFYDLSPLLNQWMTRPQHIHTVSYADSNLGEMMGFNIFGILISGNLIQILRDYVSFNLDRSFPVNKDQKIKKWYNRLLYRYKAI